MLPLNLNVTSLEDQDITVVDSRSGEHYKNAHLPNSINIMARSESDKFETWLGAIIEPKEEFYLVVDGVDQIDELLERTAKIGYEKQIKAVITLSEDVSLSSDGFSLEDFKQNKEKYTIVDIRNASELAEGKIFESAKAIPLNELRDRADELPGDKPFMVHCAGGYRSSAGSSILENKFKNTKVYDLSEAIKKFIED